jgi:hypothetical protein
LNDVPVLERDVLVTVLMRDALVRELTVLVRTI